MAEKYKEKDKDKAAEEKRGRRSFFRRINGKRRPAPIPEEGKEEENPLNNKTGGMKDRLSKDGEQSGKKDGDSGHAGRSPVKAHGEELNTDHKIAREEAAKDLSRTDSRRVRDKSEPDAEKLLSGRTDDRKPESAREDEEESRKERDTRDSRMKEESYQAKNAEKRAEQRRYSEQERELSRKEDEIKEAANAARFAAGAGMIYEYEKERSFMAAAAEQDRLHDRDGNGRWDIFDEQDRMVTDRDGNGVPDILERDRTAGGRQILSHDMPESPYRAGMDGAVPFPAQGGMDGSVMQDGMEPGIHAGREASGSTGRAGLDGLELERTMDERTFPVKKEEEKAPVDLLKGREDACSSEKLTLELIQERADLAAREGRTEAFRMKDRTGRDHDIELSMDRESGRFTMRDNGREVNSSYMQDLVHKKMDVPQRAEFVRDNLPEQVMQAAKLRDLQRAVPKMAERKMEERIPDIGRVR